MTTSDRYWHSVYLDEVYVQPSKKLADEAQAKLRNEKEYEWRANYGDGERNHTEKVIEVEEEKDLLLEFLDNNPESIVFTDNHFFNQN